MLLQKAETKHIVLLNPSSEDLYIRQEAASSLTLHVIIIGQSDTTLNLNIDQLGEGALTNLYGLVLASGSEQAHIKTSLNHVLGGGQSRQLFKYVLSGQAQASFIGQLKVEKDAQKTDAFQTNRNILLSDDARIATKPQLEIYADDVHCSHGATTGQLDDSALFYMQQRCIDKEHARRLLLEAFCGEVVDTIDDKKTRDDVMSLVSDYLPRMM